MRKKGVLGVLSVVFSLLMVAGCASSSTAPKQELKQVKVSEVAHSVFYAPQYVAIANGFFQEEGIEIELINGQGADKVMTAVVANQVDIGFSGPEAAIYVYNEGKENYPQIFAQVTKRDGSFLIGREPDENFSFDKLIGKHILGGRKGGVPNMTLEYVIRSQGINPATDLNMDTSVQFALMAGAFAGGEGDYVTLFEPTASAIVAEGKGYILASIGELSGEMPYTCYYANSSYIKENPEVIQGFTNAIYKGQQWVAQHSAEEIAKAIAEFFPDSSLELLTTVCQRHKDIDAFSTIPAITEDSFNRLQTVMEQAGELTKRADFSKLVDNSFANSVVK